MINTREQAMTEARGTTQNVPGMCQAFTRGWFNAPSVGDVDGDGDADAVDGWKSEPIWARHEGDRNPPAGVPLAWAGGRNGFGHRAISMGSGLVRSTDAGGTGITKTVPFDFFEKEWGFTYLGWSETIDGFLIPEPVAPRPASKSIRVGQSSMQFSDTDKQFAHDLRIILAYKPHVQGLTEVNGSHVSLFREICRELGYKPILPDGRGDCALAVRRRGWRPTSIVYGSDHAIDAKAGLARHGGHRARANVWVTVTDPDLGKLSFNENHMVTGSARSLGRHRQVLRQLRVAAERARKQARGTGMSWMMCDLNVDPQDFRGKRVYRLIERLGWEPVFEELKRWPSTHGRRTIDVIMHWDADRRVDPTKMRVGRKQLFTDHDNVYVDYEVLLQKK